NSYPKLSQCFVRHCFVQIQYKHKNFRLDPKWVTTMRNYQEKAGVNSMITIQKMDSMPVFLLNFDLIKLLFNPKCIILLKAENGTHQLIMQPLNTILT